MYYKPHASFVCGPLVSPHPEPAAIVLPHSWFEDINSFPGHIQEKKKLLLNYLDLLSIDSFHYGLGTKIPRHPRADDIRP